VATKTIRRPAWLNGEPAVGLVPTWKSRFVGDDLTAGAAAAPDDPEEVGGPGASGIYRVTITLGEGEAFDGVIQWNGADNLYESVSLDYFDLVGFSTGAGARSVVVTARDRAGSPLPHAKIEVLSGSTLVIPARRTGANGTVTIAIDDGSYVLRTTLPGYSFDDAGLTVSADRTAAVVGDAGDSPDPIQDGLTRALDYAAPRNDWRIGGHFEGDGPTPFTRTVANVPAGRTIASAKWTVKNPTRLGTADAYAKLQKTLGVSGTTLTWSVTATESRRLGTDAFAYDVQVVLDDGTVQTLEFGVFQQLADVTRS
jgi:hypothetical protein